MIKIRTMVKNADASKVDSTSADDARITAVGHVIRKCKVDEIPQLINVLLGHMSLVGPRPNVERDVALYTEEEKQLLTVRPGITDISSIVFSDEGDILAGRPDPDLAYNQLIRPWKSRLGILYVEKRSLVLDIKLIFLTLGVIVDRASVLKKISSIVSLLGGSRELVNVCLRDAELQPTAPPGSNKIVEARES